MDENEKKTTKRKVTPRPKETPKEEARELPAAEEMPVLSLRGLVLFPNMILHFDVGREKSILAINEAISGSRRIFLVSQSDPHADDPGIGRAHV